MMGTKRSLGTGSEGWLVAAAMVVAASGLAGGWPAPSVAILIALMPVAGTLLLGHVPGRGTAVGCLAMAVGATVAHPEPGGSSLVPFALLAGIGLAGMVAGTRADALAAASSARQSDARPSGRWATIVIESSDPAASAGMAVRPRVSPHPAPERRSTARLATRRRRAHRPATVR